MQSHLYLDLIVELYNTQISVTNYTKIKHAERADLILMSLEEEKIYNVSQISSILQTSQKTVREYLLYKKLKGFRAGNKYLIRESDLIEFIKNGRH